MVIDLLRSDHVTKSTAVIIQSAFKKKVQLTKRALFPSRTTGAVLIVTFQDNNYHTPRQAETDSAIFKTEVNKNSPPT